MIYEGESRKKLRGKIYTFVDQLIYNWFKRIDWNYLMLAPCGSNAWSFFFAIIDLLSSLSCHNCHPPSLDLKANFPC